MATAAVSTALPPFFGTDISLVLCCCKHIEGWLAEKRRSCKLCFNYSTALLLGLSINSSSLLASALLLCCFRPTEEWLAEKRRSCKICFIYSTALVLGLSISSSSLLASALLLCCFRPTEEWLAEKRRSCKICFIYSTALVLGLSISLLPMSNIHICVYGDKTSAAVGLQKSG